MTEQDKKMANEVNNAADCDQTAEPVAVEEGKDVEVPQTQQLEETITQQEQQIQALEKELQLTKKSESEAMIRAKAEVENIRRRVELDVEKAHKFALEKFSVELLPVIDNLERALEATDKANPALTTTIEGLELTLKSFLDAVKKFGIEQIKAENEALNPELHQAITIIESPEHKSGHIVNAIQTGSTLNGRLIRPAMVIVAK